MRRYWRQPLLHFLTLGALIWGLDWWWQDYQFRQVEAPSAQAMARLETDWAQRNGRQPDAAVRASLMRNEIDERILFREALRLKLHKRDPVVLGRLDRDIRFLGLNVPAEQRIQTALDLQLYVGDEVIRRRLVERMRAIGRGPDPTPTDDQLRQRMAAQADRWQQPPRISFQHVYVRQGPEALAQLTALADALPGADDAGEITWPGDPFILGHEFRAITQANLGQRLGPQFAAALWRQTPATGQWSSPLQSRYGWHRVRVLERHAAEPRPLAEVRPRLEAEWRAEQQQRRLRAWLQQLRQRYRVNS